MGVLRLTACWLMCESVQYCVLAGVCECTELCVG